MSAACWYERRCLLHIGPVPGFHVLGTLLAGVWRTLAWRHGPAVPGHARKRAPAQEGKPHRMQQQAAGHPGAAGSASSRAPAAVWPALHEVGRPPLCQSLSMHPCAGALRPAARPAGADSKRLKDASSY